MSKVWPLRKWFLTENIVDTLSVDLSSDIQHSYGEDHMMSYIMLTTVDITTNPLTKTETLLSSHIESPLLVVSVLMNKLADEREDSFKPGIVKNLIKGNALKN